MFFISKEEYLLIKFSEAKDCIKGTSCGNACIDSSETCRIDLESISLETANTMSKLLQNSSIDDTNNLNSIKNSKKNYDLTGEVTDQELNDFLENTENKINTFKEFRNELKNELKNKASKDNKTEGLKIFEIEQEKRVQSVIEYGKNILKNQYNLDPDNIKNENEKNKLNKLSNLLFDLTDSDRIGDDLDLSNVLDGISNFNTKESIYISEPDDNQLEQLEDTALISNALSKGQARKNFQIEWKEDIINENKPNIKKAARASFLENGSITAPDPGNKGLTKKTQLHEQAHSWEKDYPKLKKLATDFIKTRLAKNDPNGLDGIVKKKLKELQPEYNFRDDELAWTNSLNEKAVNLNKGYYISRIYENKKGEIRNTELYSVGSEFFSDEKSAKSLYNNDPEFFSFMVGIFNSNWGNMNDITENNERPPILVQYSNSDKFKINTPLAPIPVPAYKTISGKGKISCNKGIKCGSEEFYNLNRNIKILMGIK